MSRKSSSRPEIHENSMKLAECLPSSKAPFFFPVASKNPRTSAMSRRPRSNSTVQKATLRQQLAENSNPQLTFLTVENLSLLKTKEIMFPAFIDKASKKFSRTRTYLRSTAHLLNQMKVVQQRTHCKQMASKFYFNQEQFPKELFSCQYRISTPVRKIRSECRSERRTRKEAKNQGYARDDAKLQGWVISNSSFVSRNQ